MLPIRRATPGDALLGPLPLLAVALLVLNDHVLKAAGVGSVTGKLSDVAGLAFFPLLLVGAWEVLLACSGRPFGPSVGPLPLVAAFATVYLLAVLGAPGLDVFEGPDGSMGWLWVLPLFAIVATGIVGLRVAAARTPLFGPTLVGVQEAEPG